MMEYLDASCLEVLSVLILYLNQSHYQIVDLDGDHKLPCVGTGVATSFAHNAAVQLTNP